MLINRVLGKFDRNNVKYFTDDVLISTNSVEYRQQLLTQVLVEFIKHNLTLEPSKMQICKREIDFLGFKINKEGISPAKKNIQKIKKQKDQKIKKQSNHSFE